MKRARKKLTAKVQKVIKPPHPAVPEKAELSIDQADELYREVRIENRLMDEKGKDTRLKEGAEVEIHIEADEKATDEKK
jgi:hypothetical protein